MIYLNIYEINIFPHSCTFVLSLYQQQRKLKTHNFKHYHMHLFILILIFRSYEEAHILQLTYSFKTCVERYRNIYTSKVRICDATVNMFLFLQK